MLYAEFEREPFQELRDKVFSVLGLEQRLTGRIIGESLAYNCLEISESVGEVEVRTTDWERVLEDPDWYDIAGTVLDRIEEVVRPYEREFRDSVRMYMEQLE